MPKIMCRNCKRWTYAEGCNLERSNYYQFRDCMIERKDYSFPKETEQEQPQPEKGAEHDRH